MWWRWCGCGGCGVEMAAEVVMVAAAMEMKVGMMKVVSAVAGSRRSGAGYFERRGEMRWGLGSVETEFPAIVFNDSLTSNKTPSCEPTVSSLNNNEIDFRISFDESDDEDYTILKKEFSAIAYNDARTSKLDFLTKPTVSPQHIDEFNLKDETSLSECDEEEQNVLYFNNLFTFNVIYLDDLKSDTDNDNDEIDTKQPSGDMSVIPLPNVIDTDDVFIFSTIYRTYSLNEYSVFDTGPRERKSTNVGGEFTNLEILMFWSLETSRRKHFKTLSLDESRSPDFDLFSDQEEYSKEEVTETMAETMEQYMSKTQADYGSGVSRPKIKDRDNFELKGKFLKELRTNTFSGSDHEDANEHIEKVLEIVDLFHIPNITIDQVMLRAFPMSLTGAASRWLRNKPSGSITT
ncbi:hypothetical protein Tco_0410969 [Tanacetum coccineum]